jgi:uncharacterized protein (UPF0335 family)
LEIVVRLQQIAKEHDWIQKIVLLYFGYYDTYSDRIRRYLQNAIDHFCKNVEIRLVAVTPEQAKRLGLVASQLEAFITTEERLKQFKKMVLDAIKKCWDKSIYKENTPPKEYDYKANNEEEPESIDVDNELHIDTESYKVTKREHMAHMASSAFKFGWLDEAIARRQKELKEEEEEEEEERRREREWKGPQQQEEDDEAEE